MNKNLKSRNLKLLSRYHELTLSTKKLEKQKHIEVAEEMKLTSITVKRVIDKYYEEFLKQIGTKNTCLEGLTKLREKFKFENLTPKQIEYIVFKMFGDSDSKATKKAGYKSKSSITELKRHLGIQSLIADGRKNMVENSKYTFNYIYNSLGLIADKGIEGVKERKVIEKQSEEKGQELTKSINEVFELGTSINAFNSLNKMAGNNFEDRIKSGKLMIDIERLELEKKKIESEIELKVLRANIEVLNLEILTGNTDIEEEVQGVQESLKTWTEEAWKDEKDN